MGMRGTTMKWLLWCTRQDAEPGDFFIAAVTDEMDEAEKLGKTLTDHGSEILECYVTHDVRPKEEAEAWYLQANLNEILACLDNITVLTNGEPSADKMDYIRTLARGIRTMVRRAVCDSAN